MPRTGGSSTRPALELGDLDRFLVACQKANLEEASKVLGVASSSLSGSVARLERELGMKLFERTSRGLVANQSAQWLFVEALNVLMAEAGVRRFLGHSASDLRMVIVAAEMELTIGALTIAIANALVASMAASGSLLPQLVDVAGCAQDARFPPVDGAACRIELSYAADVKHVRWHSERRLIGSDTLVLAYGRKHGEADHWDGPVIVPRLRGIPPEWLSDRLRACKVLQGSDITNVPDGPGAMEGAILEEPEIGVVLPRGALSVRAQRRGLSAVTLSPDISLAVVADIDGDEAQARPILDALQAAWTDTERTLVLKPRISAKNIDLFRLLARTLSVTGAAKRAGIAQPAVTNQLNQLEEAVSARLFERDRSGLTLTEQGRRFAGGITLIEAARSEIMIARPKAANAGRGRFELGILPAVGSSGFLISRVARAIEAWRTRHPDLQLRLLELPNVRLQERIRRGTLDLGIITTRSPRMARFDLRSSEALALVTTPSFGLLARGGAIEFADLAALPLVLPTVQFGLRQLIDAAGLTIGVTLRPVLEVDSLAMCLALVRESRLATILPPSDVAQQSASGEFSVHAIRNPEIVRTLQIIYSTQRSLTDAERDLVRLLRFHLAATETGFEA